MGRTLVINLPGSQRGAEESLASILSLVEHGLHVASGGQTHP
jgi:molybdopterin biosynthesis enzyme MoaB